MKNKLIALSVATVLSSHVYAQDEEAVKPFELTGSFGAILTSGNTQTTSLKGDLKAHHELRKWSNDYILEAVSRSEQVEQEDGTEETESTAQRVFISGQGNYKLDNEAQRLFIFASYEDDRFNAFNFQSTIAAGWNEQLWQTEKSQFAYSVGPGYSFNETDEGESANNFIVRGALDYQYKISDSASFLQLVSTEVGSTNTKSKSESALTAKINDRFSVKISLILNHNTDVTDDRDNLDTETAVTLAYTFF
jgi:putative salt-induced outer membrane protein YdiY